MKKTKKAMRKALMAVKERQGKSRNGTLFVSFSLFGVKKTVFPVND